MKFSAFFFSAISILFFSNIVTAQCDDTKKYVIEVPKAKPTIAAAIEETKTNTDYKGKKVTINVRYGIYEELGKGVLIDRACLDVMGMPNDAGKKPVIRRNDFIGHEQAVVKIRESDIKFEGFDIDARQQCNAYGILVLISKFDDDIKADFLNIWINGNDIRDIGQGGCRNAHGIVIWGAKTQGIGNIWVQDNKLSNLRLGDSETITIKNNVRDFHALRNVISNTDNIGIDVIGYEDGSPYQARNGEIKDNVISDLREGNDAYPSVAGIYVDGGKDVLIDNNQVRGFGFGLEIASELIMAVVSGITVTNNTFEDNLVAGVGVGHGYEQRSYVKNCVIRDNKIFNNGIGARENSNNDRRIDGGQIRLVSYFPDSLENILIKNNRIEIAPNKHVQRLIYVENCLSKDKECEVSPKRLDVTVSRNKFSSPDYVDAWYIADVDEFDNHDTPTIVILNKYLVFNSDNTF
jgi:hypothetical protein